MKDTTVVPFKEGVTQMYNAFNRIRTLSNKTSSYEMLNVNSPNKTLKYYRIILSKIQTFFRQCRKLRSSSRLQLKTPNSSIIQNV